MTTPDPNVSPSFQGNLRGDEVVDLSTYWRSMSHHLWLILMVMACCTGAAVIYAVFATPIYRAETLVTPAGEDKGKSGLSGIVGQYGGLASLAGVSIESRDGREEALAVLNSRAFISLFISSEGLETVLLEDARSPPLFFWKNTPTTSLDAVDHFRTNVMRINAGKNSGLVTVAVEWKNPQQAASWTNSLIKHLNGHMRVTAIEESRKSLGFLANEIGKTSKIEIQSAASFLMQSQMQKSMLANVREEFAFKVIDPAYPPAADAYVSPKRILLISFGVLAGLLTGITIALYLGAPDQ